MSSLDQTLLSVLVAQSCPTLCDPRTVAHQGPLSMEFSRQEYWSGLPFPPPGDLPNPGIKPVSPGSLALQVDSLPTESLGKPDSLKVNAKCSTETLGRIRDGEREIEPHVGITLRKASGSEDRGGGSLTSGSPAGASGSGWRCSALSASVAPAAADALRPGSAGARSDPAPAGTAPVAGQAEVWGLLWHRRAARGPGLR